MGPIVGNVIAEVAGFFKVRQERKKQKQVAQTKVKLATLEGKKSLDLTDAEWEAAAVRSNDDSYKDEYVTFLVTSWMLLLILGSVYGAVTGDMRVVEGVNLALKNIKESGVDMGEITYVVVLAAVGIKGLKSWRSS